MTKLDRFTAVVKAARVILDLPLDGGIAMANARGDLRDALISLDEGLPQYWLGLLGRHPSTWSKEQGPPEQRVAAELASWDASSQAEPAKEAGQELPVVLFGEGLYQMQVPWKDFLAAIPKLTTEQKFALITVLHPIREDILLSRGRLMAERDSLRQRLAAAEEERDAAIAAKETAELELAASAKDHANFVNAASQQIDRLEDATDEAHIAKDLAERRMNLAEQQRNDAKAERDAANQRAERAEKDAALAREESNHRWAMAKEARADAARYRPVVEATRQLAAKFPDDGTGMVNGVLDLSAVYSALRAPDASPDAGLPADATTNLAPALNAVAALSADARRDLFVEMQDLYTTEWHSERDALRAKLAEAERKQLKGELATIVERTARAQLASVISFLEADPDMDLSWNATASAIRRRTESLLVTLATLPQEKTSSEIGANVTDAPSGSQCFCGRPSRHQDGSCELHIAQASPASTGVTLTAPPPIEQPHPSARAPIDFSRVGSVRGIREPEGEEGEAEAGDEFTDDECNKLLMSDMVPAIPLLAAIKRRNARIRQLDAALRLERERVRHWREHGEAHHERAEREKARCIEAESELADLRGRESPEAVWKRAWDEATFPRECLDPDCPEHGVKREGKT